VQWTPTSAEPVEHVGCLQLHVTVTRSPTRLAPA